MATSRFPALAAVRQLFPIYRHDEMIVGSILREENPNLWRSCLLGSRVCANSVFGWRKRRVGVKDYSVNCHNYAAVMLLYVLMRVWKCVSLYVILRWCGKGKRRKIYISLGTLWFQCLFFKAEKQPNLIWLLWSSRFCILLRFLKPIFHWHIGWSWPPVDNCVIWITQNYSCF